uniref:Uncharacterized protein n=1 Tax=Vespula pensylvanica TaxID=30213 RepID=A0A834P375_VESPE|nr:hypothetical protein H0235_008067 [Vespula pensylvanica]
MPKRKLHYVVTANWSKGWLQTEMESVVGRRLYSTSLVGYDDTTGCREPFAEATSVLARECFSSPRVGRFAARRFVGKSVSSVMHRESYISTMQLVVVHNGRLSSRRNRYTTTCHQSSRGFDAAGRVVFAKGEELLCTHFVVVKKRATTSPVTPGGGLPSS